MRVGSVLALLAFATLLVFFAGNQRFAFAEPLGSDIVCRVFSELTGLGSPIPTLNGGNCPPDGGGEEPPPPPPPPPAACADGIDNDGDGLTDGADPGCSGTSDTDETNAPPPPSQANLVVVKVVINDNGGISMVPDFSLHIATSSIGMAETIGVSSGATTTIAVGTWTVGEVQRSGYTATFGGDCNSSGQVTLASGETKTCIITNNDTPAAGGAMACADGVDNDADGKVDSADPGCHTDFNASNSASYDQNLNNEAATAPPTPQCADGTDNDGDGKTDMADPGCSSTADNDETDPSGGGNNNEGGGTSNFGSSGGGSSGGGGSSAGGTGLSPGTELFTSTGTSTGAIATSTGLVLGFSTTTESCDLYLTAFIREGQDNDTDQVKRLQRFLRDYESAKVDENGLYDAPTLAAVHAFQTKYAADILTPWGIGKSTGYVYLTTRKKVNEIFCNYTRTFLLTTDELQKIEKARTANIQTPSLPVSPSQPVAPKTPVQPKAPAQSTGTPAVGTTSPPGGVRFDLQGAWQFFRGVFDRIR